MKKKNSSNPSETKKPSEGKSFESMQRDDVIDKVNYFVKTNSLVLTVGLVLAFLYTNYALSSLAETVEDTLIKNTQYIKENIGHPIFLSATGQVVVADKSPMGYYDKRFKDYVANSIVDSLVNGLVRVSGNFKIHYKKKEHLLKKNPRIKSFYERFIHGKKDEDRLAIMETYIFNVYHAILEGRMPEYIDPSTVSVDKFLIKENKGTDPHLVGRLKISAVVKSWIKDLGRWDTRELKSVYIDFEADISPPKYADIGNPFGVDITRIDIPSIIKPTARSITEEKR